MKIPLIDLARQHHQLQNELEDAFKNILNNSAFIGGPDKENFEKEYAEYCGTRFCIGLGNGTDSLFIALKAMGIKAGDEVITVANSFIASSECISQVGARVVFVDCDDNYLMDLNQVEKYLQQHSAKVKAIIPVHLYGQMVDMPRLMDVAKKYDLKVLEDSAQAHGASINGKRAGSWGNAGSFSFYPGKNLGALGDAGALVTNDEKLAENIRKLANHGRIGKYNHEIEGHNSRLDGLQAAFLRIKLRHLDQWNQERIKWAQRYNEKLKVVSEKVVLPNLPSDGRHVIHMFVVRLKNRDQLKTYLKERGIDTGVHYPTALPNLPAYQYLGHKQEDFPRASQFQSEVLSLPLFPGMTEAEHDYICNHFIEGIHKSN